MKNGSQVSTNPSYSFTVTGNASYVAVFSLNSYTISVSANPSAGGTVSGGGTYDYGSSCTLTATPATGYSFVRWMKNGSQVSTNPSYSFTVTGNASYVAVFSLNSYTISVSANPSAGGTVSGGGTYDYGSSCTLTATPATGYSFVRWMKNGSQVSTNPSYNFTVTGNASYVAVFSLNSYTISASSSPSAGGSVSGAGSYNYGSICTLTATPATGYSFVRWTKNGSQVSTNPSYSFTVTADANYVAVFSLNSYTISVSANPSAGSSVSLSTDFENQQIPSNWTNDATYPWVVTTPEYSGYNGSFCMMSGNGGVHSSTSSIEVTVEFIQDGTISFIAGCWGEGTSTIWDKCRFYIDEIEQFNYGVQSWNSYYYEVPVGTHTFRWSYSKDSSVHPTGDAFFVDDVKFTGASIGSQFNYGQTCALTATPNEGYTFVNWTENGEEVSTENPYSFTVTGNRNLVANFALNSYDIIAEADPEEGGTVSGAGNYNHFETCTLTATANIGYTFMNWTENGEVVSTVGTYSFTVMEDRNLVANFIQIIQGAINGRFSVDPSREVLFSQGNLQYQASTNTWRFAENQYDCIGSNNSSISENNSGWIDLFGWGTSGYDHGAVCYQPWSTSQTNSDYYAYGNESYNLYDKTGQADWGYNPISNGGNVTNTWRSLTSREWNYLISGRSTASGIRWVQGTVNGMGGVILLPDDWSTSIYTLNDVNGGDFSSNTITAIEWISIFEANGAVFLPAAGIRYGTYVQNLGSIGMYWSSSCSSGGLAAYMVFFNSTQCTVNGSTCYRGLPVRLVCPVTTYNIDATSVPNSGGTTSGSGNYNYGNTCTLIASANEGYIFRDWSENDVVVSYESNYSFVVSANRNLVADFMDESSTCSITFDLNDSGGNGWNGNYLVLTYEDGFSHKLTLHNGSSASYVLPVVDGSHIALSWIQGGYVDECSFTISYSNGNVIYYGSNLNNDFNSGFDVDCEEMPLTTFEVSATANPSEGGTVTGEGVYELGSTCVLTAKANDGYTFMWMENGNMVSKEATYSFIVTGDRNLVANFIQVIPAISDNFNDGEINSEFWTATGSNIYEEEGMIELQQNVTDNYVALESAPMRIPSNSLIVIDRKFLIHEQYHNSSWGDRYFYGNINIKINGSDDDYIGLWYYDDDYENRHGTYLRVQLNGEVSETRICDAYFDTWLKEKIVLDITDKSLAYYLNDTLVSSLNIPSLSTQQIVYYTVRFKPDGWWTGHYHNMDYVNINTNNNQIPIEGLVAYYPFDGNANDYSGNGNHGSIIGNVVPAMDRKGNPNGAYRFPGQPFNYISVPDSDTLHLNSFTLSAWVYTDADDYGSGYLINKGRDINNGSYRLCVRSVGATTQYGGTNDAGIDDNPEVNQWHMITGTVEGDQACYYLDGVLLDEKTLSQPFSCGNSEPLAIGMHYFSGVPSSWAYDLLGVVDEVRIYNRALSSQEVKQLYNYSEGCLPGLFSVSGSTCVNFSQGNLQYIGSAETPYWKFADNQWDCFGDNGQGGDSPTADRDLFGWGTSGYNHGANAYQPWCISEDCTDYYAYGDGQYSLYDQTGQADWGYNAISNGGNKENIGWRTLTQSEWDYVLFGRNTTSGIRFAHAKVNGVNGMILLPDDWIESIYALNNTNANWSSNYADNIITVTDWVNILEPNGVVFLPASGRRWGSSFNMVGEQGFYWSSSCYRIDYAYFIHFFNVGITMGYYNGHSGHFEGNSVRLARFDQNYTINITAAADPTEGGTITGVGSYEPNSTCTLTAIANEGYSFVKWTKNGETVSYFSPFSFTVTEDVEFVAHFEETSGINVGTPELTNLYLPSYSYYNYTLSQQIYTPDEIGTSGFISSIGYFNVGETKTRNYDIYMVHTDKNVFENNTDWITVTEADRVFSGEVTMESGYWTSIVLDTPFAYDGTSNLAIIVDDNSGNYTVLPHMECRVFNTEGNQTIRVYSDNTNYDPMSPPSSYANNNYVALHSVKNQMIFGVMPAYHFVTAGTWGNAANWSGGALPGAGDAVFIDANCALNRDAEVAMLSVTPGQVLTLRPGKTLSVTGNLFNTAIEGLVVEDGAQLVNTFYNVAATVKKNVQAYNNSNPDGWYTISSPMNGMVIEGSNFLTSGYDLYRFNETNLTHDEWENYKANLADFTIFEKGRGYLYANSNTFAPAFTGILNNMDVTYTLTCTERPNDPLSGFNLIGNPFPHEIYKGAGGAINNVNLASGYYTLTNEGTWEVHSFDDAIQPGQGFLVKATVPTVLTIAKSNEVAFSESGDAKKGVTERMCISVAGENGQDRTYVYFSQGVGLDKKNDFDAQVPNLWIRDNGHDYAIAHVEDTDESLELCFSNRQEGDFTLAITTSDMEFEYLQLIDRAAGVTVDLLKQSVYTFHSERNEGTKRFTLAFKKK